MQYPPSAAELLRTVARLLDDEIMVGVRPDLQHKVRVASHLLGVVGREIESGADDDAERALVAGLVRRDGALGELTDSLADQLRAGEVDAPDDEIWEALVAITRKDLAIAKPGHDRWEHG